MQECTSKDDNGKLSVCSNNGYCAYGIFGDSKYMCLPEFDDDALCKTCNRVNAEMVNGECISKKCMTHFPDGETELCGG